jgi:hypothetical protein
MGTRRMFGKMTVVVLAKTKKQRGAGIQDRRTSHSAKDELSRSEDCPL